MKLLLAHLFQEIFVFGQNLKHVHLTYALHELLISMIFFWLTLVTLFKVWFPNVSKKYCTQIHTLNDKIKTKGYTFSPVSDVNIEESCFFFLVWFRLVFHEFLFTWTNVRVLISTVATVFYNVLLKNIQIMYFCSEMSSFLVLHETLHFDKFEC